MGLRQRLGRQRSVHSDAGVESPPQGDRGARASLDRSRMGVAVENVRSRFSAGTIRPRTQPKRTGRHTEALVSPEPVSPVRVEIAEKDGASGGSDRRGELHLAQRLPLPPTPLTVSNPSPLPIASLPSGPDAGTRLGHEALLPAFRRMRPQSRPLRAEKYAPYYGGSVLSDDFVAFTVPEGWCAVHVERGFRLSSGPCIGFVRATASVDASAALCDTSDLTILDTFDIASSPVVDGQPDVLALVVDYRNHGAGRGVALFESGNDAGAAVFGLSGPAKYSEFLREAERELLSGAHVLTAPLSSGGGERKLEPSSPSPTKTTPSEQHACIIA